MVDRRERTKRRERPGGGGRKGRSQEEMLDAFEELRKGRTEARRIIVVVKSW